MTAIQSSELSALSRRSSLVTYTTVNLVTRGSLAVLGIYAANDLGWSASHVAFVVAYGAFAMRFGRVIVSSLLRRANLRLAVILSMTLVSLGLLLLAMTTSDVSIFTGVTFIGVGYGGTILAIKVVLVVDGGVGNTVVLSNLAIAVNVGAAAGPLAAGALVSVLGGHGNYGILAIVSVLATGIAAVTVPPVAISTLHAVGRRRQPFGHLPRSVIPLLAILAVSFALYAQLYSVLPLLVDRTLGGTEALGILFAVNAALVVIIQRPASKLIDSNDWVSRYSLAFGFALFGLAILLLANTHTLSAFLSSVAVASVAECLVLPVVESRLASIVGVAGLTLVFTLSAVAMGLGETAGAYFGVQAVLGSTIYEFLVAASIIAFLVAALDISCGKGWHPNHVSGRRAPELKPELQGTDFK